jgi:hypothetical protein
VGGRGGLLLFSNNLSQLTIFRLLNHLSLSLSRQPSQPCSPPLSSPSSPSPAPPPLPQSRSVHLSTCSYLRSGADSLGVFSLLQRGTLTNLDKTVIDATGNLGTTVAALPAGGAVGGLLGGLTGPLLPGALVSLVSEGWILLCELELTQLPPLFLSRSRSHCRRSRRSRRWPRRPCRTSLWAYFWTRWTHQGALPLNLSCSLATRILTAL